MAAENGTIVLVHGAWADGSCWQNVILPLRRLGLPEEVAKAIYYLCTDQSSYVTGAELHINGGQHV